MALGSPEGRSGLGRVPAPKAAPGSPGGEAAGLVFATCVHCLSRANLNGQGSADLPPWRGGRVPRQRPLSCADPVRSRTRRSPPVPECMPRRKSSWWQAIAAHKQWYCSLPVVSSSGAVCGVPVQAIDMSPESCELGPSTCMKVTPTHEHRLLCFALKLLRPS